METSPMAGKSWQPSYEPQHRKGEQVPDWIDSRKRKEMGGEKLLGQRAVTPHNATSTRSEFMQECLQQREYGIPVHACMWKTTGY